MAVRILVSDVMDGLAALVQFITLLLPQPNRLRDLLLLGRVLWVG